MFINDIDINVVMGLCLEFLDKIPKSVQMLSLFTEMCIFFLSLVSLCNIFFNQANCPAFHPLLPLEL